NRSAISALSAVMAAASSAPSVSRTTVLPLLAASIITPMMLFALTRRPLRVIQTSDSNWLASWVSFADARACKPSLFVISTSLCCIRQTRLHVDHPIASAADRLLHHDLEPPVAIGEGADEHRQVDAGNDFHHTRVDELAGQVAGRGAIDVGEDEDA